MKRIFGQRSVHALRYAMLIAFALSLLAIPVFAQDPTPTDNDVNQIARQLFCPVCENTPLDVCPTEACRQWRELIRTMLSEGKSESQIKQYFVEHYGIKVLNVPPNPIATYLVPAAAFLIGAFLLFRGFQMWIKPVTTEADASENEAQQAPQDEYAAKFVEEVKKRN